MAIFDFNNLSSLSDVELSVYRFVVNNPEKVAYMRVRDIAQKTHVANSSVMRFVHKIGFASFPEFKAYLKNINQTVAPQKALTFINQQNFPNDIENKLRVVADQLYLSDNIPIIGTGNSTSTAVYAARMLALLGFNAFSITDPFYPLNRQLENTSNNTIDFIFAFIKLVYFIFCRGKFIKLVNCACSIRTNGWCVFIRLVFYDKNLCYKSRARRSERIVKRISRRCRICTATALSEPKPFSFQTDS